MTGTPLASGPVPATSAPLVLEVDTVSKSYGSVRALVDARFAVARGQIVGLLGPNGAGKSTCMKAVMGLIRPDAGQIRVLGRDLQDDPVAAKRSLGYVPESPSLYEFLTGAEYLDFVADMYGLDAAARQERIPPFLEGLELAGHENALISGYSQGMRQKVALIAALLHRPRLLVLDEPLNGLDPRSARVVKDLLRSLATRDGVGVLFSTHVLEIAQAICDRVVILSHGRVLASDTVDALRARAGLSGSALEDVFLSLTGTGDLGEVVEALSRAG
ncbi:MAG TPA: ABC transporter ATP-binding protein [Thermoplasmata archaeon]|nr:ABC transporter ATP-binding protein [Thermoplasmata archaeon]